MAEKRKLLKKVGKKELRNKPGVTHMSDHGKKQEDSKSVNKTKNVSSMERSFGPLKINDVTKSMGLKDFGGSVKPMKTFKRIK